MQGLLCYVTCRFRRFLACGSKESNSTGASSKKRGLQFLALEVWVLARMDQRNLACRMTTTSSPASPGTSWKKYEQIIELAEVPKATPPNTWPADPCLQELLLSYQASLDFTRWSQRLTLPVSLDTVANFRRRGSVHRAPSGSLAPIALSLDSFDCLLFVPLASQSFPSRDNSWRFTTAVPVWHMAYLKPIPISSMSAFSKMSTFSKISSENSSHSNLGMQNLRSCKKKHMKQLAWDTKLGEVDLRTLQGQKVSHMAVSQKDTNRDTVVIHNVIRIPVFFRQLRTKTSFFVCLRPWRVWAGLPLRASPGRSERCVAAIFKKSWCLLGDDQPIVTSGLSKNCPR